MPWGLEMLTGWGSSSAVHKELLSCKADGTPATFGMGRGLCHCLLLLPCVRLVLLLDASHSSHVQTYRSLVCKYHCLFSQFLLLYLEHLHLYSLYRSWQCPSKHLIAMQWTISACCLFPPPKPRSFKFFSFSLQRRNASPWSSWLPFSCSLLVTWSVPESEMPLSCRVL